MEERVLGQTCFLLACHSLLGSGDMEMGECHFAREEYGCTRMFQEEQESEGRALNAMDKLFVSASCVAHIYLKGCLPEKN